MPGIFISSGSETSSLTVSSVDAADAGVYDVVVTGQYCGDLASNAVTLTVIGADPTDLNNDGLIDGADLGILLGSWGPCPGCPADLNGDGVVDGADLGLLLGAWTQ